MSTFTTFLLLVSTIDILIPVGVGILCLIIGYFACTIISKKIAKNKLNSTERIVADMLSKAEEECRALKKDAIAILTINIA